VHTTKQSRHYSSSIKPVISPAFFMDDSSNRLPTGRKQGVLTMERIKQDVAQFLTRHGLYYKDIDTREVAGLLLRDMENGLAGKQSSLKMIPTYIRAGVDIPPHTPVIVIDAGGTHLRVASVLFDESLTPHITNFRQHPMPGTQGKVDKTEFFARFAGHIEDIVDTSDRIGFCFSYPTEILPSKDGRLLFFSKEIDTEGIVGRLIGENLLRAIADKGKDSRKRVVILNDTVATLLAARARSALHRYGEYIGFILGTGLNCCYSEKNSNITKTPDLDPSQTQIINTESGGFDKCPRGDIDRQMDAATGNPGLGVLEKMISGAYFGELCLRVITAAAAGGLFSRETGERLRTLETLSTKEVNEFLISPQTPGALADRLDPGHSPDGAALYYLLDALVERSAALVSVLLCGMVIKNPPPPDPRTPVCISAEGSTFFKLKGLKARVECGLRRMLTEEHNRYFEFVSIENAPLIGAAIAGLTN
jgi:hexokinase